MTKDELYNKVKEILVKDFAIEADKIKPEAKLFTELDLDSIDAVDMLVKMKPYCHATLSPEQFKKVRTVQDIADAVYPLMQE
jgi:acyl carrier protein